MPYNPESVSILIRFQSQVPRTIMHFTSVIFTFLRCCAARSSKAAGSVAAPQTVFIKQRRFIFGFPLGRILVWTTARCYVIRSLAGGIMNRRTLLKQVLAAAVPTRLAMAQG